MSGQANKIFQEYSDILLDAATLRCLKDTEGRLVISGDTREVRAFSILTAFPITRPGHMVSVRDADGEEVAIIDDISKLDPNSREVVQQELEKSYFMPRITDIIYSEEKLGVLTMEVDTDKGSRTFQIRNIRKSIRQVGKGRVIIRDVDGNRYEIPHWASLYSRGRNILMEYL